jgi:SAM-dependent methyltransferase
VSGAEEARILASWHSNAAPWTNAVRRGQIESRRLVTNAAIVGAVLDCSPRSVLDIGCGEGWLARELDSHGIGVTGIDAVPALVEQAQAAGGGTFRVASYEDVAAGRFKVSTDVAVCNFSLLGDESVGGLFRAVGAMLDEGGAFIVQTLHPVAACGDLPYQDGWRRGSWDGCGTDFTDPAPWYFRTLETWTDLFRQSGLRLRETREPMHPVTGRPASVIFIAEPGGRE